MTWQSRVLALFIAYAAATILGAVFYKLPGRAHLKQRLLPWYFGLTAVLFLAAFASLRLGLLAWLAMAVVTGILATVNLARTYVCPRCGITIFNTSQEECSECGV